MCGGEVRKWTITTKISSCCELLIQFWAFFNRSLTDVLQSQINRTSFSCVVPKEKKKESEVDPKKYLLTMKGTIFHSMPEIILKYILCFSTILFLKFAKSFLPGTNCKVVINLNIGTQLQCEQSNAPVLTPHTATHDARCSNTQRILLVDKWDLY